MPGEPSKIINRAELEEQRRVEQARDYEILRKKNIEEGGVDPGPMQQPSTSGVANRRVGFSRESASMSPTAPQESFAETETRKRRESAASGAFGTRAQAREENLAARRGLFAEMKAAAEGTGVGTSDFRERAKALGIDEAGYARGIARAEGTEIPKPTAPAPAAPLQGRALAESNIATMGVQGAAADYFKRAGAERDAADRKMITSAPEPTYRTGQTPTTSAAPPAAPTLNFARSFAQELNRSEMPDTPSAPSLAANIRGMEDYGDSDSFKVRPRGMEYNEETVGRVKGVTSEIDKTLDAAVSRSATAIRDAVSGGANTLMSEARKGVRSARRFQDRTNLAADQLRKRLGAL
jgi:hypothetical protein